MSTIKYQIKEMQPDESNLLPREIIKQSEINVYIDNLGNNMAIALLLM